MSASARSPLEITKRKLVESMETTCEFSDALLRCNSNLGMGNKGKKKKKKIFCDLVQICFQCFGWEYCKANFFNLSGKLQNC